MKVEKTRLDGLVVIHPDVHDDKRGYFFESYNKPLFKSLGIPSDFVQDNQALSGKNTLRGLHYQLKHPQGKLIQVTLGKVYDISLDIRHGSPTFGQYFGIVLSDKNFNIVYVPEGFAHGYAVLSDTAIFQYKCTETYHPEDEHGIKWNDPSIHINWQITNPNISEKDLALPSLTELGPSLLPAYRVQK
tara:strand:- start:429 stop:992 length:564 start_codon:yes stop_codon:yes gene_type:complete